MKITVSNYDAQKHFYSGHYIIKGTFLKSQEKFLKKPEVQNLRV